LFISFRGYLSLILFIDLKSSFSSDCERKHHISSTSLKGGEGGGGLQRKYEKLKDETKVGNEKKQTQKQYKPERKTNTTTL
jgi:hypothetical protein